MIRGAVRTARTGKEQPVLRKKYVFFVSHSTKDVSGDVGEICEVFDKCKILSFIADRDAPPGKILPDEIKKAIEDSELFLVFLTRNSKKSIWVNQEVGYALGIGTPVIPIKRGKIQVDGLIESIKYIQMRDDPLETVREIFTKLGKIPLSRIAQASIGGVIGILELTHRQRRTIK